MLLQPWSKLKLIKKARIIFESQKIICLTLKRLQRYMCVIYTNTVLRLSVEETSLKVGTYTKRIQYTCTCRYKYLLLCYVYRQGLPL